MTTEATEVAATPEAPQTPAAMEAQERQALIDIVEGVTPEAEDVAETPAAKKKDEPAAKETPAESRIAVAIRAREQAQKTRDAAASEASSAIETAKAEAAKIIDAAKAEAKSFIDGEVSTFRTKWREKPLQAIKEATGVDTRRVIDDVEREGRPEWQAQVRLETDLEKANAKIDALLKKEEARERAEEERTHQAKTSAQRATEQRYLDGVPKESALRALYTDGQILAMTYDIAAQFRDAKPGDVASDDDLRLYLESEAAKKLASIRGTSTATSTVSAAKRQANGPRTPSASSASERRASPKPAYEMDPDEAREAQKRAAEDAMSAYAK